MIEILVLAIRNFIWFN